MQVQGPCLWFCILYCVCACRRNHHATTSCELQLSNSILQTPYQLGCLLLSPLSLSQPHPLPSRRASSQPATMGIIKKTFYTTVLTGTAFVGYVAGSTSIIRPLPRDDPIWKSNPFNRYNVQNNPSTQDVCIKRVPLSKIRPELLEKDGDLALEFCRGVWAGWGELPLLCLPCPSFLLRFFSFGGLFICIRDVDADHNARNPTRLPIPAPHPRKQVPGRDPRPPLVPARPGHLHLRARHAHNGPLRGRREDPVGHHRALRRQPRAQPGPARERRPVRHVRRGRQREGRGRAGPQELLLRLKEQARRHPGAHAQVHGDGAPVVLEAVDGQCQPMGDEGYLLIASLGGIGECAGRGGWSSFSAQWSREASPRRHCVSRSGAY